MKIGVHSETHTCMWEVDGCGLLTWAQPCWFKKKNKHVQIHGNGKAFPGPSIYDDSVCRQYRPQLPPLRWLQPGTAPYRDSLLGLGKPFDLVCAYITNVLSFRVAVGATPSEHMAHRIPVFLHVCLSFHSLSPQPRQSHGCAGSGIGVVKSASIWKQTIPIFISR